MKYFATLISLFLIAGNASAQVNLVPNGGFNEYEVCTTGALGINACSYWFNPNSSCTPDYYHACANGTNQELGVPDNYCNYYAYEGDGMARIGLYSGGGEPIEVKLTDTLQEHGIYQFSMKLKRDCFYGACGSIGALFTDTVFQPSGYCDSITAIPQLQRDPFDIMSGFDWYSYVDTLYAQGGECYLTITNFLSYPFFVLENGPIQEAALYWIDDVSLVRIGTTGIEEEKIQIKLTSELVSEQLEVTTDKPVQLHLLDFSGRMILSEQLNSGRSTINVSSIPNGMYVAVFTSENGQTTSRKILKAN